MSGAVVVTPSVGAAWATAWEQFEGIRKGLISLSLTNYDAAAVPQIASGSWIEAVGSIYKWTGDDAIVGAPTNDVINYITMVPSGVGASAILTPTWSDSAPTWSDAYQGFYSGTTRYAGGCYYDGTNYTGKWVYGKGDVVSRAAGGLRVKTIDIGDWNMDTTAEKSVAHGLGNGFINIRMISVQIINDAASVITDFLSTDIEGGVICYINNTNVVLTRDTDGSFDGPNYDATSYNRGWVTIWYGN